MTTNIYAATWLGLTLMFPVFVQICGFPQYKDMLVDNVGQNMLVEEIDEGEQQKLPILSELFHGVVSVPRSKSLVKDMDVENKGSLRGPLYNPPNRHTYIMDNQDQLDTLRDDMEQVMRLLLSQGRHMVTTRDQTPYYKVTPRMKKLNTIKLNKRHCWNVADVCCMWNICTPDRNTDKNKMQ